MRQVNLLTIQQTTMSELDDEISAIDAIFPGSVLKATSRIYDFVIPEYEALTVQLSFPSEYPDDIPNVIQVFSKDPKRYADVNYIERSVTSILLQIWMKGEVCIFELFTELQAFLEKDGAEREAYEAEQRAQEIVQKQQHQQLQLQQAKQYELEFEEDNHEANKAGIDPLEGWIQSEPIIDRGSTFIAFVRPVNSVEEARDYLDILTTDRKIARAAHNISSWRVKKSDGVQFQDCDDDGETAAGSRLLHLLTVSTFIICWFVLNHTNF